MVDSFGTPDATPGQPVGSAGEFDKPKGGFLSTTLGKIIIGGAVFVVVLGALAAIAVIFIFGRSSGDSAKQPVVAPAPAPSAASGAEEATPTPRPETPLDDTFAFRNIFQPTIKITLTPVEGEGTDGTSVDVPANTLYLVSVSTVDGEQVAELIWNGNTYTLSEGETIPDTPWKVLSISGDTVVMLFGDTRVTLTVGQGISK